LISILFLLDVDRDGFDGGVESRESIGPGEDGLGRVGVELDVEVLEGGEEFDEEGRDVGRVEGDGDGDDDVAAFLEAVEKFGTKTVLVQTKLDLEGERPRRRRRGRRRRRCERVEGKCRPIDETVEIDDGERGVGPECLKGRLSEQPRR